MKWEGNRESDNVEDYRGVAGSGSGGGFGLGGRSIGIGTIVIALIGGYVLGVNPLTLLNLLSGGGGQVSTQESQAPARQSPASDDMARFVKIVLADTEDTWGALFKAEGGSYVRPKLRLFSGSTETACGTGQSASGPFYCPGDQKIYLDLDFFKLMQQRFKVSGEFAEAYVIAHEVGHHVQNLLGLSEKVDQARRTQSERQANAMSVRLELQADCFAGVWAFHANQERKILEQGDVEAALKAATAIGDDALQRQSQGHVVPDSFTHGSSEQRVRWFSKGLASGQISQCNTFEARQL
ncbi:MULTISPECIES: neutral zinc metallopeptidase [unclassified Janthinobacterium]|uniref:KPN_02809 family neutral zinc metallopeptidase n=1 Tax=unclassified Janthinobacterium TaxID=2610881 RepID=UPI0018CA0A9C|nr:neutral zinc metallopeptidase [Janthinobacterium sp. CG_23.4]MDH6157908.1 putative metalloprotease [Janthinobacterium sp. CG_23.4]